MGAGHELGRRGEALAAELLEAAGWRILARNFRYRRKEIDLIARRGAVVAFVEVKARAGPAFGHPLEAVTAAAAAPRRGCVAALSRAQSSACS